MNRRIKELEIKLNNATTSEKCSILLELGQIYSKTSPEACLELSLESIQLSQEIENSECLTQGLKMCGSSYSILGKYDDALNIYNRLLDIYMDARDKTGMGATQNDIGSIYWYQGNYQKALEFYMKSLKSSEKIGDKKNIYGSYNNIGMIHWILKDYDKALEFYNKSLEVAKNLNRKSMADPINNIGIVFSSRRKHKKALTYYIRALQIYQEFDDKKYIANSLVNIADTYENLNLKEKSLEFYQRALEIKKEIGDKWGIVYVSIMLGRLFIKFNNWDQAILYLKQAEKLGQEINAKNLIRDNYEALALLYEKKEDYKKALKYHKLYTQLERELFNMESKEKIAGLTTKYEIEKKEKELISMKNKFINLTSHELRTPLSILSGHSYLLRRQLKKGVDKALFLKILDGTEASIKRLIGILNDIFRLSQLNTMESAFILEKSSIHQLIKDVEASVLPFIHQRQQQFEPKLPPNEVFINIKRDLIWQSIMNLVLNGIRFTPDGGKITVTLKELSQGIEICVEDTGVGIPIDEQNKVFNEFYEVADLRYHSTGTIEFQAGGLGIGLSIAKSAVELHGGTIQVESEVGKGSKFTIHLPDNEE